MNFKNSFVIFIAICCISVNSEEFGMECGRKRGAEDSEVDNNKWPWLVGFVYQPYDEFFCSGHLISERHVLSGKK
jgi:hypothetical protein